MGVLSRGEPRAAECMLRTSARDIYEATGRGPPHLAREPSDFYMFLCHCARTPPKKKPYELERIRKRLWWMSGKRCWDWVREQHRGRAAVGYGLHHGIRRDWHSIGLLALERDFSPREARVAAG